MLSLKRRHLAVLILLLPGCAAGALPPSLTELGSTMQAPSGELRTGLRVSSGVHLASATTEEEVDFDVGGGYVYERIEGEAGDIRHRSSAGTPNALDGARSTHGGYLSFDRVVSRNRADHYRTWVGLRVEYLDASQAEGGPSLSVLARGSWEIFGAASGAGAASDSCTIAMGAAYGSAGLGVYAEGGARRSLEGEAAFVSTAGVSLRLPALFGMGISFCSH